MLNLYLENTSGHHSKFYHMIENKDGVSFTASWGRIGSQGRTQIYDMSEWNKIHRSKTNKGYKSQHHNNPTNSNWIQGMSVAQRKKQGITTVSPPKKAKKKIKPIKKTAKKIHYDVGQVDVKTDHSHQNKLRILKMTMENWAHDDGKNYAIDSKQGRMYEADLHKVTDLMEVGLSKKAERDKEFLTKEEMLDMNVLFKTYGGKRKTND